MNRTRSSRKLETETKRNIELIWLLGNLTPDHGTISKFVKDNKEALRKTLKKFTSMLKDWSLIEGELVVIDGTKIKAQNSQKNIITLNKIEKLNAYYDEQIEKYMKEIEKDEKIDSNNDDLEIPIISSKEATKKIEDYLNRKNEIENVKQEMIKDDLSQKTLTDSECRHMKNNGKFEACYNMQISVDSKNKLIVDCDVVNDINDLNQLSNMIKISKETLNKENIKSIADTGYYNGKDIKDVLSKKDTVYIKPQTTKKSTNEEEYSKEKFIYVKEKDYYICPEGQILNFKENTSKDGVKYRRYQFNDCNSCKNKDKCTTAQGNRTISRSEYEEYYEEVAKITNENNDIYKLRKTIVEHPFGTIKGNWGYTIFYRRGLKSVNAEGALFCVAYNLKRAINILGIKEILIN
ncbi:MAG: transposase [Haloplasmataceae bacterium]|nr:transposase [Haloplasmataceae bacterium]